MFTLRRSARLSEAAGKDQRGQALVFSLVTVAVVILVMLATFNVGQATLAKIRLQNAADAAVYSAAQAQARDYNFSAYTNRAMIANEVAVAQVVGLRSWAANFNKTYTSEFTWVPRMLTALGGPLASWMWNTPWNINKNIAKTFDSGLNTIGPVLVKGLNTLNQALNVAQMFYHYGTALTVAQTIGMSPGGLLTLLGVDLSGLPDEVTDVLNFGDSNNVLKMNDPEATLTAGGWLTAATSLYNWLRYTERKDPNVKPASATAKGADGAEADRLAGVVMNSLDPFSRDRSTRNAWYEGAPEVFYITPNPFVIDPTRFIPYQNGAFMMWLWHRGGTELKSVTAGGGASGYSKKTWTALDATGFTGGAIFWISILGIPIPIPIIIPTMPMGWGAAQAGKQIAGAPALGTNNNFQTPADEAYGGVYQGFNTALSGFRQRAQGAGNTMGCSFTDSGCTSDTSHGLKKYFDVKNTSTKANGGPTLLIEVQRASSTVPNSSKISKGRFEMAPGKPGDTDAMKALSRAEVYFSRPSKLWEREDGKKEFASLYSPYWQARLTPNSFLEKYASMMFHLL
ncbi:pilus assembly protein TadG-related protein [Chitinimonas sp. BJYL2]|uniref:pilus assembly protein TadG-related protein n=1 Tax=Chitinimonas sp. BJYL2 TaxID=2976696 RepID=UPI0022B35602|nr:pilus assembly protein TadG-related protein [Chitinimonas sp. BJYL2]